MGGADSAPPRPRLSLQTPAFNRVKVAALIPSKSVDGSPSDSTVAQYRLTAVVVQLLEPLHEKLHKKCGRFLLLIQQLYRLTRLVVVQLLKPLHGFPRKLLTVLVMNLNQQLSCTGWPGSLRYRKYRKSVRWTWAIKLPHIFGNCVTFIHEFQVHKMGERNNQYDCPGAILESWDYGDMCKSQIENICALWWNRLILHESILCLLGSLSLNLKLIKLSRRCQVHRKWYIFWKLSDFNYHFSKVYFR